MLIAGTKVVYPSQGPCLVGDVVKKIIGNTSMMFYQLRMLDDNGGNLFIPVDKIKTLGIRPLLKKSDIPELLDVLKKPTQPAGDHRDRDRNNSRLLAAGSAFDLAEVVGSLT